MFLRALAAFLILPGLVGAIVPALIVGFDPWPRGGLSAGYAIAGLGLLLLAWCVRDFYVSGKGTLAPWWPPQEQVTVGLYRHVRNPIYVSVIFVLLGWCAASGSTFLLGYTVLIAVMFHRRVVWHEEPWLAREFGEDWLAYSRAVGRWIPRLNPWFPGGRGG